MLIARQDEFPGLGAVEGSLWPTTGDINNETASLASTISQVGHDIGYSSVSADDDALQTLLRAWNAFVGDFTTWKDAAWFWNPTRRDELLEYRARFNTLLGQIRAAGIATLATTQAAQREPDSLDKTIAFVNKAIVAAGVVASVYIGWKVYRELR